MKVRSLFVAISALCGLASASAAVQNNDLGAYTLSYDDTSVFGSPSFSFSSSGGVVGFGWTIPNAVQSVVGGGSTAFNLPSFTVTANSGHSLSSLNTFIGNLSFFSLSSSEVSASANYTVALDGGPGTAGGGLLNITTLSGPVGPTFGYLAGSSVATNGNYSTLAFDGSLNLTTGTLATIYAQPQNELKFSLIATPVPEPESYAMLLAGLGLIGGIARRKKIQG